VHIRDVQEKSWNEKKKEKKKITIVVQIYIPKATFGSIY